MVNAIFKIKEMQKKLNMINNNIEEIKNERKSFEESKKINEELIYSAPPNKLNNMEKNLYFKTKNIIRNKSNIIPQKYLKNSSNYNNFKMSQTYNINRNSINYENASKLNNDYIYNKIKNDENFIDNYSNKKYNYKKNKTYSISTNAKNKHRIIPSNKKTQTRNNFYKRSILDNNINYYQNQFINSSNINENSKNMHSYGNNNMNNNTNYLKETKRNNKVKNYFNKSNIKSSSNNNINILNNNDYNNKNIINENFLYAENKDSNDNFKEKIKLINNGLNNTTFYNTNLKNNNFHQNIRTQRNLSFNFKKKDEIQKIDDYNNYSQKCFPISPIDLKRNISKKDNVNYEQIVSDIIDITNEYNNGENKANLGNIIEQYKLLLRNIKLKEQFIFNITNQYNKINNTELNSNDPKTLVPIWNWIIKNEKNFNNNINNEEKEYMKICKEIMQKYKIHNIQRFKKFINKSLQKIDTNENFLEGIKKILSA